MNNAILIQHSSSGPQPGLIEITRDHHQRYCDRRRFDYRVTTHEPVPGRFFRTHPHAWERVRLILDALHLGYEHIVYLDTDTVIAQDVDLRDALDPGRLIGLVWYDSHPAISIAVPHYNAGAMYLRARPGSKDREHLADLFMTIWGCDPLWFGQRIEANWCDNMALVRSLELCEFEQRGLVKRLDPVWNHIYNTPGDPIVEAWHGYGDPVAIAEQMGRLVESAGGMTGGMK